MLKLRLQRMGKKKFPTYRLVISENKRDTQDKYLEQLGTFNPHAKENQAVLKTDRINYWLKLGAQASDTVHNLLVKSGVVKGDKKKSVFLSKKRKAKLGEKKAASAKAAEEKAAAAQAAAEAPAAEAPAA